MIKSFLEQNICSCVVMMDQSNHPHVDLVEMYTTLLPIARLDFDTEVMNQYPTSDTNQLKTFKANFHDIEGPVL